MNEKKKILVVEDEKPLGRALKLKLTRAGYAVFTAFDGEEAAQALTNERFDVVLLDLVMPQMDGFKLLEKIQYKQPKPYIIVLSNLSQKEDIDKAMALGAKTFFIKADQSIAQIIEYINTLWKK